MEAVKCPTTRHSAVVCWSAGPTKRQLLQEKLAGLGLDKYQPEVRSDDSALNGALTAWCKDANAERNKRKEKEFVRDKIVQRRQKRADGFEVVDVERGQTKNHYTPDFGAKVTAGAVVVDNGWADQGNLQERFAFHKNILSGAAVGKALISFLVDNGAIALRDGGGVYWIPREAIDGWVALAEALEACPLKDNGNRVQMLHVVMDEHAVKAIKEEFTVEIEEEARRLASEIATGTLGDEALQSRKARADALHGKIAKIEQETGQELERLHGTVTIIEQAAAMAALQAVGV